MSSRRPLVAFAPTLRDLPGSSTDLSTRAVPNHPGRPDGCSCLLLPHRRFQASSCAEDWPPFVLLTRPNRVHLLYGSRIRRPGSRQIHCCIPRPFGYMQNRQLHDELLSVH